MKKKIKTNQESLLNINQTQFTGKENHFISIELAAVLTRTYRETHPNETIAEFFGKEAILAILNQPECVGIRIYYGQEPENNKKHLVVVGAKANKDDIFNGLIAERALTCPSFCPNRNDLNS